MGTRDGCAKADVVEQEEFWFRPEQHGVGDAGGAQVLFSALGDRARVAVVTLQGAWFQDIAADDQRRFFVERVDQRRGGIRHQDHVGFVNTFPTANRGAIKHFAFFKEFGIYLMGRNRDVLFFTFGIGEAQIDKLHFVLVQHRQNVFSGHT